MQQLYITDLDHTLLTSEQKITAFSKNIWNRLSQNTYLTIATARSFAKIEEFMSGMELNAPLILFDGAMILTIDKEIIDLKTIEKELVDAIIGESKKFDIEPFILALEDSVTLNEIFAIPNKMNQYQSHLIEWKYKKDSRVKVFKEIEGLKKTLKVVYMGEKRPLTELKDHLKSIFDNQIEIKLSPENYTQCWFLTILHPLGDKAHAVKKVTQILGVPLENTTVFGDNINDIGMFKIAGTSIAVNNALDILKEHASIILPHSNDEDAVAKYLESIKLLPCNQCHTD